MYSEVNFNFPNLSDLHLLILPSFSQIIVKETFFYYYYHLFFFYKILFSPKSFKFSLIYYCFRDFEIFTVYSINSLHYEQFLRY